MDSVHCVPAVLESTPCPRETGAGQLYFQCRLTSTALCVLISPAGNRSMRCIVSYYKISPRVLPHHQRGLFLCLRKSVQFSDACPLTHSLGHPHKRARGMVWNQLQREKGEGVRACSRACTRAGARSHIKPHQPPGARRTEEKSIRAAVFWCASCPPECRFSSCAIFYCGLYDTKQSRRVQKREQGTHKGYT